uniref:Eukaryotic translation initiation factor 3 subunit K n=1 Tax=Chelonoidis abingdonii TaxID=106734 RepID=A0A8C0GMK4_CHEAB
MALFEQHAGENVGKLLRGSDLVPYNPENLATLERYVETQAKENAYDLEANLAVLKLYQFNPAFFQTTVTAQILLKALTNLPHTDFTLCKCMIDQAHQEERPIRQILYLGELLETCHFQAFWVSVPSPEILLGFTSLNDLLVICHVVGITYQHIDRWLLAEVLGDLSDNQLKVWMSKYGWTETESGKIFICNQEESIKPKNIVEKIDFDSECCVPAWALRPAPRWDHPALTGPSGDLAEVRTACGIRQWLLISGWGEWIQGMGIYFHPSSVHRCLQHHGFLPVMGPLSPPSSRLHENSLGNSVVRFLFKTSATLVNKSALSTLPLACLLSSLCSLGPGADDWRKEWAGGLSARWLQAAG